MIVILNEVKYSGIKCTEKVYLRFLTQYEEVYVVDDSFPISTDGILGSNWELAFKAKIDREKCTYTVTCNKENYVLIPGYHPTAYIPPQQTGKHIKCLSKNIDGIYFVDAPHIISRIYELKENGWKFISANETPDHYFLYREQLEVLQRDNYLERTDNYESVLHARDRKSVV